MGELKSILILNDDPSNYMNDETSLEINILIALKKVTDREMLRVKLTKKVC